MPETVELLITTNTEEIFKTLDDSFKKTGQILKNDIIRLFDATGKKIENLGSLIDNTNKTLSESFKYQKDINEVLKYRNALTDEEKKSLVTNKKNIEDLSKSLYKMLKMGEIDEKQYKVSASSIKKIVSDNTEILEKIKDKVEVQKLLEGFDKKTIKAKEKELKLEEKLSKEEKRQAILAKLQGAPIGFFRRRQIANEATGTSGIGERMTGAAAIPGKMFTGMGKAVKGVTSLFGKLVGAISTILPPLAILGGGFLAFGAALLMAEKRIKEARREIIGMAAETGELDQQIIGTSKSISVAGSKVDVWRRRTESYVNVFGLAIETARQHVGEVVKAGFTITETFERVGKSGLDNFSAIYAQSVMAGKEFAGMVGIAGQLREEFGSSMDESVGAFIKFRKNARESGISTSRFFDKVMNVASGMGIYGHKIEEISQGFADLSENMRLPEKATTEAAARLIGGFKDLTTEQQVLIAQTTTVGNKMMGLLKDFRTGGPAAADAMAKLEKLGIDEKEAKRLSKITDPLNRAIQGMRALAPAEQFKARFEALTKAAGIPIDINNDSIQDIDDVLQSNTYQLEKMGEKFGFSKEDIIALQSLTQGLSENVKAQKRIEDLGEMDFKTLKDEFPDLAEKFEKTGKKRTKENITAFVGSLDKNIESLGNLQKILDLEKEKKADTRLSKQMRLQTRSTYDALEQNIAKILNNIYDAVQPIIKTLKRYLLPIKIGLKKGFLMVVKGLNWIAKVFGKDPFTGFILEQELEILTEEAQAKVEQLTYGLEDLGKEAKQAKRDVTRLEDKMETGRELSAVELQTLVNARKLKDGYDDMVKSQNAAIASARANQKEQERVEKIMKKKIETDKNFVKDYVKNQDKLKKINAKVAKEQEKLVIMGKTAFAQPKRYEKRIEKVEGLKAEQVELKKKTSLEAEGELQLAEGTTLKTDVADLKGLHSPVELKLMEPAEVLEPQIEAGGGLGKTINDNRVITINVNHRDKEYIEQVVLNAIYTDKM